MNLGRREFIGLGIASAAGMCVGGGAAAAKSRSWYNGVEVGCITYSYRSMRKKNAPKASFPKFSKIVKMLHFAA